jgi:hypothetical protein
MAQVDPQFLRSAIDSVSSRPLEKGWSVDADLYQLGVLDSYAMIQLVIVLEEGLQIVFDYGDLRMGTIGSLRQIETLLNQKYACSLPPQV